jgi:large-conductance mechanosensitive channel
MFGHFYDFISKSNLFATAIGFLASTQVISLVNALFDHLVAPIINYILIKHNHPKLKEYTIKLDHVDIEMGAFLLALIKFLSILSLIYLFITHFNIKIEEN